MVVWGQDRDDLQVEVRVGTSKDRGCLCHSLSLARPRTGTAPGVLPAAVEFAAESPDFPPAPLHQRPVPLSPWPLPGSPREPELCLPCSLLLLSTWSTWEELPEADGHLCLGVGCWGVQEGGGCWTLL